MRQRLLFQKDVREIDDNLLYNVIGYLSQSEYMFQDTIENNILLYSDKVEITEKIMEDCCLLDLEARIKNVNIGDMGEKISGGEKQRIALARVLTRKPALLIIDEPTAGLDAENARDIMETVFSLDGVTRIIISHDESIMGDSRFCKVLQLT